MCKCRHNARTDVSLTAFPSPELWAWHVSAKGSEGSQKMGRGAGAGAGELEAVQTHTHTHTWRQWSS